MAYVAVMGYGTVGSGVVETLNTNQSSIDQRSGEEVRLKYVLDLRDFPDDPVQEYITHSFDDIINDDEIKVVVEVMGGIEPAFTFTKACLEKGKSVVTSNKELVAKHGAELLDIAKNNNVNFMFEASVGGGIPIIRPLNQSLTAEDIYEISGILNGTTNYILTKMKRDNMSFKDALELAQKKGYAEKVPDADVLGHDACRKIAILSSLAYGKQVDFEEIFTEGITDIKYSDIEYADEMDSCIKLIAKSKKADGKIYASVSPVIIPHDNPLSNVDGVFNAILVEGNIIGQVMFYGKGAGKLPTASAVVADVIDCVKHSGKNIMHIWSKQKLVPEKHENTKSKFFVRLQTGADGTNIEEIDKQFPDNQKIELDRFKDECAFITQETEEAVFNEKIKSFGDNVISKIRVQ